MIPYVPPPVFHVGPLEIHAFGVLAAAAVVVGVTIVSRRAARVGLDGEAAHSLAVGTVVGGLVVSHLFAEIVYFPDRVLRQPTILLELWGSMSSFGGILGGLATAAFLLHRRGWWNERGAIFIDCVAFAFPFAWLFGRLGCALAHDHPGIPSTHWLAVDFPEGPRFDLGLLELLYTIPVAIAWIVLSRKPRPTGFWIGLFFVLYAPARFVMDTLRAGDVRYAGWVPSQYASIAFGLLGAAVLAHAWRRGRAAA